jgi:hypothetical protein
MNLSKNFTAAEMACPLTGECKLQKGWIELLQQLRDHCGFPFRIVAGGGCRTREFNKNLKGAAPNSFHLIDNPVYGTDTCAVDIATKNNTERTLIEAHARGMGLSVIVYPAHIHVDARTTFAGLPAFYGTGKYKK